MINYYRIPHRKGTVSKDEYLHISDDSDLKDALFSKSIQKAKILSFKNANIKDDTLRLLNQICTPLPIIRLDLSQNFSFITDTAIQILVEQICFKNLKVLNLADNQISDDTMVILARASSMHHLEELILYGNTDVTGAGLLLLSQSPFLKHIKNLDLHATSVDDEGIHEYMKSQNCKPLEIINLSMSWKLITNKTLYSMANSKYCQSLKELLLEDCGVGDQGMDELSQSQNVSNLQHLSLNNSMKHTNNIISDKTLTSIALSKYLVKLKNLELRNTNITAKGVKTLAVSPPSESIQILRISHCKGLESEVLPYIQRIASYQSLKKVYLNDCAVDREDLQSFELKHPNINLIF